MGLGAVLTARQHSFLLSGACMYCFYTFELVFNCILKRLYPVLERRFLHVSIVYLNKIPIVPKT